MDTAHTAGFDALWASMPGARVQIRVGTFVYEKALSSGVALDREPTDIGQSYISSTSARILASAEQPDRRLSIGIVIEVRPDSEGEWKRLRIASRKNTAGVIELQLEDPYQPDVGS
jgi:hypothetical protein